MNLERDNWDRTGPAVPFGASGVAAAMASILGLVCLTVPTTLLESTAFQLYLDQIIASAVPPFGWTAHIVAALVLGVIGGLSGWGIARLLRVQTGSFDLTGLLNKIRGVGHEDDVDAPTLRSMDRHPDAPARRPFSAASDIPTSDDDHWQRFDHTDLDIDDDEDGELLLDGSFVDSPEPALVHAPEPELVVQPEAALERNERIPFIDAGAYEPAPDDEKIAMVTPSREAVAQVQPLDLSIGKLDDLLARLEAGLAHRHGPPSVPLARSAIEAIEAPKAEGQATAAMRDMVAPAIAPATDSTSAEWAEDLSATQDSPTVMTFPQDQALAAALATLRRMNQHVG